jgi:hypothetical protein
LILEDFETQTSYLYVFLFPTSIPGFAPSNYKGVLMGALSLPHLPSHHLLNVLAFVQLANKNGDIKILIWNKVEACIILT